MGRQPGTDTTVGETGEWRVADEDISEFVSGPVRAVASLVRSTLGPAGLDTLVRTVDLQNEPETVVTSDAGEVVDAIHRGDGFNHPVAALLIDCVASMQQGLGDGVATTLVLAEGLVEEGFSLVERGLHPTTVAVGFGLATTRAGEVLDDLAEPVDRTDVDRLADVAVTSFGGALTPSTRATYADGVARAVRALATASDGWIDADDVAVRSAPGLRTRVHRGLVVRRRESAEEGIEEMSTTFDQQFRVPEPVTGATVAVIDEEIDFEDTASAFDGGDHGEVVLSTADAVETYADQLDAHTNRVASDVAGLGVDVLVSQAPVENPFRAALERRGVNVVDRVEYPKRDVYRLGRATGANVVRSPESLTSADLGTAGRVSERRVGDELWTTFADCPGAVITLVTGGGTERGTGYRERLLSDAVRLTATAASDEQILPGAGAPPMAVATAIREEAPSLGGPEQLAFEAVADALERPVYALAKNAGLDPLVTLTRLRSDHAGPDGPVPVGLNVETGEPMDALAAGVCEPRRLFSQAFETAATAAELLVTIDDVLYPGVDLDGILPRTETDKR